MVGMNEVPQRDRISFIHLILMDGDDSKEYIQELSVNCLRKGTEKEQTSEQAVHGCMREAHVKRNRYFHVISGAA